MATAKKDGMKKTIGFLKDGKQMKNKTASSKLVLKAIKTKKGK